MVKKVKTGKHVRNATVYTPQRTCNRVRDMSVIREILMTISILGLLMLIYLCWWIWLFTILIKG